MFLYALAEEGFKDGYYTDKYFLRAQEILENTDMDPEVTMQFFAKKEGVVAGLEECEEIIRRCEVGCEIDRLMDGDDLVSYEPVMHLSGKYRDMAFLETILLGVLARRSLVATNANKCVEAANGKPVIYMGARHDDWRVQDVDGYAVQVGGIKDVSTDIAAWGENSEGVGTMPHSLIACFRGDIPAATLAFHQHITEQYEGVKTISLVDYNNNCVDDALEVARKMEARYGPEALFAVRLDTSESMLDYGLEVSLMESRPGLLYGPMEGVNKYLVQLVRDTLDNHGFEYVKIIVSGGFTPSKIRSFEDHGVPVDGYGVGSSILGHSSDQELYSGLDFTADIVKVDGELEAKEGREFKEITV